MRTLQNLTEPDETYGLVFLIKKKLATYLDATFRPVRRSVRRRVHGASCGDRRDAGPERVVRAVLRVGNCRPRVRPVRGWPPA